MYFTIVSLFQLVHEACSNFSGGKCLPALKFRTELSACFERNHWLWVFAASDAVRSILPQFTQTPWMALMMDFHTTQLNSGR